MKAILMVLVSSGWHMMIFMIRSSTDGGTLAKTRLRCCFVTSRSTCFPIYVEWRKEKWAGKGKVQNESEELLDELCFDVFCYVLMRQYLASPLIPYSSVFLLFCTSLLSNTTLMNLHLVAVRSWTIQRRMIIVTWHSRCGKAHLGNCNEARSINQKGKAF